MKSFKFIITIICCVYCAFLSAQTTYKGVTIDRDRSDVTCIVVTNSNSYPVNIKMDYKIISKDTEWKPFRYGEMVQIPANETRRFWAESKIYGLNLNYVDILKPSVVGQIFEVLGGGSNQQEEQQQQNDAQ